MNLEQYKQIADAKTIELASIPDLLKSGIHIKLNNAENWGIVLFKQPQDSKYDNTSVTFQIFKVLSLNTDGSIYELENYCSAYIRWDSCSHFHFRDEGYLHLCGVASYKFHIWLLEQVYMQAFIAMDREPELGEDW